MNRRLYRCRENRAIAGVAAGVAEYFGLDPTLVRVLWFLSIFFGGLSIVLYIGLAIIMPLEPITDHGTASHTGTETEAHRHLARGSGRLTMVLGIVLILFGAFALVDIALPGWASWRQLWPLLVISIGGLLIVGSLRREQSKL